MLARSLTDSVSKSDAMAALTELYKLGRPDQRQSRD
jgi:hypothetical protein